MQISLDNDPSLSFDPSEPLVLAKKEFVSIDLADFLSLKTLKTSPSLSTNDSASIKADEESSKSLISGEIFCTKMFDELSTISSELSKQKVTLGDIISKRAYTKRSNDAKKVINKSDGLSNKKKRLSNLEGNTGESIVKKEKLDNKEIKEIVVSIDNKPSLPEIVLKDGKVHIIQQNNVEGGEGVKKALEVVIPTKKKITTSTSFKPVNHTEKWTEKETEKFYRALELFGTDFSMVAKVFKSRNRNQIKNKFLREEKLAPEKVDKTLKGCKSNSFHLILAKFEKLKKTHQSGQHLEGKVENNTKEANLLLPLQIRKSSQDFKQEELVVCRRGRNDSFHSTTSIDSMDRSIIEDLADVLLPSKKLFGN